MSYTFIPQADPLLTTSIPEGVSKYLASRGWMSTRQYDPITNNLIIHKTTVADGNIYCSWAEAMAYEYYLFITLGGNTNGESQ